MARTIYDNERRRIGLHFPLCHRQRYDPRQSTFCKPISVDEYTNIINFNEMSVAVACYMGFVVLSFLTFLLEYCCGIILKNTTIGIAGYTFRRLKMDD